MDAFKYIAFISYQRKDEEWAKWLHHQLEHYHLPDNLENSENFLGNELRPMFLDEVELAGGSLSKNITTALMQSRYLIVLCSPNSAQSVWVNKEVQTFIDLDRAQNIIPVIIGGTPYVCTEEECFVPALHTLRNTDKEPLGINALYGREIASVKVVAQIIGVGFDFLWNRYEREKAIERQRLMEDKRRLQRVESRYLAEKGMDLFEDGNSYLARRIAIKALPKDIYDTDDRPFVGAAGELLLKAMGEDSMCFNFVSAFLYCVKFSPDDKMLAVSGVEQGLRIIDTVTGMEITRIGKESLTDLDFSPDGKRIVGSEYSHISIYNLEGNCEPIKVRRDSWDYCGLVKFSPDGEYLVSTKTEPNEIILWRVDDLTEIIRFKGHSDKIRCVGFSPDGKMLASGSDDKNVRIWDIQTGKSIRIISEFNSSVYSVYFNIDGSKLIIGLRSGYVVIYNIGNYCFDKFYKDHQKCVFAVKSGPKGMKIFSVSLDNMLVVKDMDPDTYDVISNYTSKILHKDILIGADFSSDGKLLASISEDRTLRVTPVKLDTIKYYKSQYLRGSGNEFCFTPDSKHLIYGGVNKETDDFIEICKWNLETDQVQKYKINSPEGKGSSKGLGRIIISSDGKYLVISLYSWIVMLLDAEKMEVLKEISVEYLNPRSTSFFNDNKEIITFDNFGNVCFRSIDTLMEIRPKIEICSSNCNSFFLSKNENIILGYKYPNKVSLYDIKDGKVLNDICNFRGMLMDADFSSDGKYLLIVNRVSVMLWDYESNKCIREYKGHENAPRSGKLSPDGRTVITCDERTVKLWDANSGECFCNLKHHEDTIDHVAFSPNGALCVSSARDGYIKVWNICYMQEAIDITRKRFAQCEFTEFEKDILQLE